MADTRQTGSLIARPAVYRIRVQGRLHSMWVDYVRGMEVSTIETEDHGTVTELIGMLPDQAALMGILQQLNASIIPVLCAECLSRRLDSTREGEGFKGQSDVATNASPDTNFTGSTNTTRRLNGHPDLGLSLLVARTDHPSLTTEGSSTATGTRL